MNLLVVHECFGAFAGAESNLFHTAGALQERSHRVGLLHGARTGKNEAGWEDRFPERFPLGNGDPGAAVKAAIGQLKPDAIYIHKMADLEVLEALARSGRPVVRMVHDHDLYCLRSYKYNPLTRRICHRGMSLYCVFPCGGCLQRDRQSWLGFRWAGYRRKKRELKLNRRFDRLLVAGRFMRRQLELNHFPDAKIEVHPPVPPGVVRSSVPEQRKPEQIIYTGQIVRGKGVDVLLQALARVRVPFECLIFGDGNHRQYCENLCGRLGLGDRVHFRGFVDQRTLNEAYHSSSLMAVSSVWPEPFGAVGLEAMRCGLPVVGFEAGGIDEWLRDGENGFCVEWMNIERYAARLEQLLTDPSLARRMGESALRMAEERFNYTRYIDGLENMFHRVIAEAAGGVHPERELPDRMPAMNRERFS
jgi:glycosyltransferase involved in cell wall biosynthesis